MEKKRYCNMCGKECAQNQEDYLSVEKGWGYFSKRDQTIVRFHICEDCFWDLAEKFRVPAEIYEQTEFL